MGKKSESLRLEWWDADKLDDNPRNWRRHPDKQLRALEEVIGEVGYAGALLYNERTKRLIDGHARKKISKGGRVPVLVGRWTEKQEATILATLDPLAAMAETDQDALDSLLESVGVKGEALEELLLEMRGEPEVELKDDVAPIDRADELREKWGTERGQLWTIGNHRLMCGDSTSADDVTRLMGGEKAGLCFTSPPYAQQRDYEQKINDWDGLMRGVFGNLPMTEDGQVLVNLGLIHRDGEWVAYWDAWIAWMRHKGWRRFGWYVWDQGSGLPGTWSGHLAPSFEFVFHLNRKSREAAKCVDKKPESVSLNYGSTMRSRDGSNPTKTNPEGGLNPYKIPDSVFRITRAVVVNKIEANHPAVYPVGLPSLAMQAWTVEGESCFDPFLGSGTTMSAAEQLGRRCYGLEIEPKYVAVCLERLASLGLKPQKEKIG